MPRYNAIAAPLLFAGATLVYALPQNNGWLRPRDTFDDGLQAVTGEAAPATSELTPTQHSTTPTSSPDIGIQDAATNTPSSLHESYSNFVDADSNTWSYGSTTPSGQTFSIQANSPSSTASSSADHGTLAPAPASHSTSGHGVLAGVVAGGLVIGLIVLVVGLWFCYRRRGPTSGASTPKYTTTVVGDEKPQRGAGGLAFLRTGGGILPSSWKKSQHVRVRSSMSFASPILEQDPKMVESAASSRTPLAPHLSGSTATRWSTFSSSDSSVYPQTPVGRHLSGIIMETVVETDANSNPQTPTMRPRNDNDYLILQRSSKDSKIPLPPALNTDFDPRITTPTSHRFSDDPATPTTISSGGLTFGHGSYVGALDRLDRLPQPPMIPTQYQNNNSSGSLRSSNGTALLHTRPKFNVTGPNGSDTVSLGNESGETIRITNPFLDDEDGSSYGHGMLEVEDIDGRSLRSMDSDIHGAYPSSNGCLDPNTKLSHSPSPSPDPPLTRPRSSLISDSSSDYPYPLGYAVDSEGNVANPFLRISELLEEVDGRMRWPSPPLLNRSESRNL